MDFTPRCVLCSHSLDNGEDTVVLSMKGVTGINDASIARGIPSIQVSTGQRVHVKCRLIHTDKRRIEVALKRKSEEATYDTDIPSLRSKEPFFRFKDHCFLCGTQITDQEEEGVFCVRTWDFQTSISRTCDERGDDDPWADAVRTRIIFARDLPAVDAIYHQVCSVNFRTGKQIPLRCQSQPVENKVPRLGRPVDLTREEAFIRVVDELREVDDEQTSVSDLVERMSLICESPYSVKYMRAKLDKHFGDNILITNINGRPDIVTFRTTAAKILQTFYDAPKLQDEESMKRQIVRTAAQLIKSDIKSLHTSDEFYPDTGRIQSLEENLAYLPEVLRIFLQDLFSGKSTGLKVASIGQCMIQMTRPRVVLAPLPFGLAVQMHHQFGSRFLIDSLSSHGFCVSYSEVLKFSNAACFPGTDVPLAGRFGQYVADNVDHNSRTLDGHGTFHGMGLIVAVTPAVSQQRVVPRLPSVGSSTQHGKIVIRNYKLPTEKSKSLLYEKLPQIDVIDKYRQLDVMWKISWPLRPKRPGWSGTMQAVCKDAHPGKSSVQFLPMIDMDPTDMSCIYTTLLFVAEENRRHGTVPILTFDQPLWWKAKTIIVNENENSELKQVVLKLGGFHTTMSFLGCIGHVMNSSGIKEVLELVYADNAVTHMLSGKAYARAVRGHFLVDAVLNGMVLSRAYCVPFLTDDEDEQMHASTEVEEIESALWHYDKLLSNETCAENVCSDLVFDSISAKLEDEMAKIAGTPTGSLWMQYMRMIDLLRCFLRAQREGNFLLYLKTLKDMLPFLAAAGHTHYAKSGYIFLQDMLDLNVKAPEVYNQFISGLFVVRRSDRFWGGLPADMVIEQALMRTMKTTGGLTRGRGMEERQRTRWLLAMPACAGINEAMQELTGTQYQTNDQHKDLTGARRSRDHHDMLKIASFFHDYCPFEAASTDELRNIATGVTASQLCNPHKAEEVGMGILMKMEGQDAFKFSFKRKDQVHPMGKKTVSVGGEKVVVDPQLLFQRLLIVANNTDGCDLNDVLKYELSTYPPALFDKHGLLREANKAQLLDVLATIIPQDSRAEQLQKPDYNVFDGGSLIHRFPWKKGSTFDEITRKYVDYVEKFTNPLVIFDGYGTGPSTKDITHLRRSKGVAGPKVVFTGSMSLKSKKEQFLANIENKQRFIYFLCEKLEARGIRTLNADGDADTLIAISGVDCSKSGVTHVIGEDTDILVLLCYYAQPGLNTLIFRSDKQKVKDRCKNSTNFWDIGALKQNLGSEIAEALPFIHAIGGCDTTSRLFGVGKGVPLRKLQADKSLREQAEFFFKESSKEAIQAAGEKVLVALYGGKDTTLDILRSRRFRDKVVKSVTSVQIQNMPPTSDAGKYHCFRVYYQVMQWTGQGSHLQPDEWGWSCEQEMFFPQTMDSLPAPESLLKVIRCQCKGSCDTQRCSCRKHGLECTDACSDCSDGNCANMPRTDVDYDMEEDNLVDCINE